VRRLVDERWGEYGIESEAVEADGHGKGALRQLLRR
jgi:hypothetical protein